MLQIWQPWKTVSHLMWQASQQIKYGQSLSTVFIRLQVLHLQKGTTLSSIPYITKVSVWYKCLVQMQYLLSAATHTSDIVVSFFVLFLQKWCVSHALNCHHTNFGWIWTVAFLCTHYGVGTVFFMGGNVHFKINFFTTFALMLFPVHMPLI